MKRLNALITFPRPKIDQILQFEAENGIIIPILLKEFWMTQNVFRAEEIVFSLGSNSYYIQHFYPFSVESEMSVQNCYADLKDHFQNEYLAFADDPGGWQFVISLRDEDFGQVFFCRMDSGLSEGLALLSENMVDFLKHLSREGER